VFALISMMIALTLVRSAVRRVGFAGCLAMFAAFVTTFGEGPPQGDDWSAGAAFAITVFVAVRLARSWGRRHEPGWVVTARDRLAGRAADGRREPRLRPQLNHGSDDDEYESSWRDEEVASRDRRRSDVRVSGGARREARPQPRARGERRSITVD
jgi:hypothetical protein